MDISHLKRKLLFVFLAVVQANANDNSDEIKSVFKGEFPLTSQFRSGPRNPVPSYEKWESLQFLLDDEHTVDLQTNVLRFAPSNYEFADRFAREHPKMVMMSTWRAASGNPAGFKAEGNGDPLGESVIDFPGHFVLSPGTYVDSSLSSTKTIFPVEDVSKLIVGPALLVEEDIGTDEKVWEKFEYVLITSKSESRVTVEREFNGSPPSRSFPSSNNHRIYIANFPWDFRVNTDYTDWFFNFSPDCPQNPNGQTATDVILSHMIEPMKIGGPLEHLGGLDLASGPLSFSPENADYDLDGIMDDDSKYWEGVINFYNRIWNILGEDRVLITELNFEMTDFVNGPNLEGLARPNDPWDEVSKTVNNILAWKVLSDLPFIGLSFVQYMNNEEDLKRIDLHRLLNGYSTCLGLAADVDDGDDGIDVLERDELFKGKEKIPHWLGKSTGPLVRQATMSPNLLLNYDGESKNDWAAMIENLDILRADLEIEGDELVIKPNGKRVGFVTFYLNFQTTEKTDLTIFMEAISDDDNLVRNIKLPRISVDVSTGPVQAKLTNKDYLPISWLVRGAEPSNVVTFDIRFGAGGNIRIRQLSVHAETDALACQFENGLVLINPSLEDVEFDLRKIFPDRRNFRRINASNVAKENLKEKYHPQYDATMEMNNGDWIENKRVTVGERNALFLTAKSIVASPGPPSPPSTPNPPPPPPPPSPPSISNPPSPSPPLTSAPTFVHKETPSPTALSSLQSPTYTPTCGTDKNMFGFDDEASSLINFRPNKKNGRKKERKNGKNKNKSK